MRNQTENPIAVCLLLTAALLLIIWLLSCGAEAFGQEAAPTPAPQTAQEWWDWFAAHKLAVIKQSRVNNKAENRPLEEEITLSDPKLLPKDVWGVRRYRKYREDESGKGLWHLGEAYEIIAKPDDAIVPSDKLTAWTVIKADPKYNPSAEVAPK